VFHDDIGTESFVKVNPFLTDGDGNLAFYLQSQILQFSRQDDLVNGFQEAGPKFSMETDRHLNHSSANLIFTHLS